MLRQHNALVTRISPDMNPHPTRATPRAGPPAASHGHLAGATGLIGRALCAQWLAEPGGLGGQAWASGWVVTSVTSVPQA
jgi:hypothetical protein